MMRDGPPSHYYLLCRLVRYYALQALLEPQSDFYRAGNTNLVRKKCFLCLPEAIVLYT